jgi:hypothetical protein
LAYQFAGFFAKPPIDRQGNLPEGAVWRHIAEPFLGVGVRLPALIGERPAIADVQRLLRQLGLHRATDWLYVTYDCFGGDLDFVYGVGVRGGHHFGPLDESDWSKVEGVYLGLMGEFGVEPNDALRFAPFRRGFWGNA